MGSGFFSESELWVSSVNEVREDPDEDSSIEEGEEIGSDSDLDESVQMGMENLTKKMKKKKKKNHVLLEGFVEDEDELMRTKSLTDEDLDELKGCVDLGFGFSYDEIPELCNTLPALELCYSMSQKYMDEHQKSPESSTALDSCSSVSSPIANWKISSPGDHPEDVKARLKFWAQAVACTVRLCN
ncbi:uncharacterized protein LOC111801110 [Cucurbita pepo subsp. pepo]|uniref:Uncharacterized protein LOC111439155 n=1 Tax=Cucurbita moschata TaxID=3662 RepID=A0A6J1EXG0_CUCMO|nr:uncharacterized protein LOC111439155 [Cucurbita moschata]XP_023540862.1 uncharacterized protein LOC111801110 [Cucurbita pepo subsp. pepo]